jgi:hypothetical protein
MATAIMRNRVSTEFRKVERDSEEYMELQAQRDANDGRPVWEETHFPNAKEQSERLKNDAALPVDVGDAEQPVATIAGSATFAPASTVNEPLPSEVEAGADQGDDALFGLSQPPAEMVPLTGAMEDATDTDLSGTDESIAQKVREAKEPKGDEHGGVESTGGGGASGSKMRKGRKSSGPDGGTKSSGPDGGTKAEQEFDKQQEDKS